MIAPVTMKTSSTNMPLINVSAYVAVQQPVTVMPSQIILAPGPFTNAVQQVVSIRSTATNALVLSDASINVPGAAVRIEEPQPGRYFNLAVDFPVGFQIKPGEKVELSVKSNHPKFELIKVPVFQPQPAAATGVPGAPPTAQVKQAKAPASAEKPQP